MKRLSAIGLMLMVFLAAVPGCQPPAPGGAAEGYAVMFEGKPYLTTSGVYHQGVRIGEIVGARAGFGNIVELKVAVGGEYRELMTEDAVFYPASGHLEYDRLSPAGAVLPEGAAVLGFSSKLSYTWYRVANALGSRKAAEKARDLQARIQWAEAVDIAL